MVPERERVAPLSRTQVSGKGNLGLIRSRSFVLCLWHITFGETSGSIQAGTPGAE